MNRPLLRYTFLSFLLAASCAFLLPEPAHGQRMEKVWRCLKCGQHLGEGLQRPTYCHNCDANARRASTSSSNKSKDGKLTMGAVVGVGFLLLIGAAAYIMRDSGS